MCAAVSQLSGQLASDRVTARVGVIDLKRVAHEGADLVLLEAGEIGHAVSRLRHHRLVACGCVCRTRGEHS